MEVLIASIFSTFIIFITIYSMLKVFRITYKKKQISFQKFIAYTTATIIVGLIAVVVLPIGYQKILEYLY